MTQLINRDRVTTDAQLVVGALKRFGINSDNLNYEDLFSEALLTLVKARNSYDNTKSKFLTHFFNQIKYMVLEYHKKNRKNSFIITKDFLDKNSALEKIQRDIDRVDSIEDNIIKKLDEEKFSKVLSTLKKKEIDIIKKRFWEEMSFSQIAEFYNSSKQAIQQMLKRVLDKLKKVLSDMFIEVN